MRQAALRAFRQGSLDKIRGKLENFGGYPGKNRKKRRYLEKRFLWKIKIKRLFTRKGFVFPVPVVQIAAAMSRVLFMCPKTTYSLWRKNYKCGIMM
jgi:hypothetical protein